MTQFLEIKADLQVKDSGEITGLAWPWGIPDRVGDVMTKGALSAPDQLPMLWSHDQSTVIGVWSEIKDTGQGVEVKGRLLIDEIPKAKEVHALIKSKAVNGLSIGFETKQSKRNTKGRTISAANLLEISIVAVPCHPDAQITSLKGGTEPISQKDISKMENEEIEQMITDKIAELAPANDAPEADTKAFEAVQKRLDQLEAKSNRPQGVHIAQANEDKADQKAFGNFLRRGVERLDPEDVKALTVSTDANGGYLAPEETGNELIKLLNEFSPLRQYAKVINISGQSIVYPRRIAGTSAEWVSEIANRTASDMTFEQVTLTPHELATFTDVSNALLEDNAYGLEGELLQDFAESFARTEGLAFVKGTGTGQPNGIMTEANGILELDTGAAAGFPSSNPADVIIAAYHKVPSVFAQKGVWMMNRDTLAVIRTWKDGNGRYLVLDPITEGAPSTLLGRPVIEMPDMDDIGADSFPVLFGDMEGYRIVDRVGLTTLRDPYTLATNGQVRFHARKRVGADLTYPDRFVKIKCAT